VPDLQRLGLAQPARLVGIEHRAALRDGSQRLIHRAPARLAWAPSLGRPRERPIDLDP